MSADGAKRTAAEREREEFVGFFPQIVRDLTEDGIGHPEVGDAVARLKEVRTWGGVGVGGYRDRGVSGLGGTGISGYRDQWLMGSAGTGISRNRDRGVPGPAGIGIGWYRDQKVLGLAGTGIDR